MDTITIMVKHPKIADTILKILVPLASGRPAYPHMHVVMKQRSDIFTHSLWLPVGISSSFQAHP